MDTNLPVSVGEQTHLRRKKGKTKRRAVIFALAALVLLSLAAYLLLSGGKLAGFFENIFSVESLAAGRKETHDAHHLSGLGEDRFEEACELIFKRRVLREEDRIDILRQAFLLIKIVHVVRNTAKNHVGLHDVVTRHAETTALVELFALCQRERGELDFVGGTTVQTAVIVNKIVEHPRVSTTADHEHDVLAMARPTVPKGL